MERPTVEGADGLGGDDGRPLPKARPAAPRDKTSRKAFRCYPLGYFHIDIAEVRTEEGKLHPFVAVDRTSKYAFARLKMKATTATAREFLDELAATAPYRIHTVLTDNGIQFANLPKTAKSPRPSVRPRQRDARHRASTHQARPFLDNGQLERMNRTLKEAAVRGYHYESHDQLEAHLAVFLRA